MLSRVVANCIRCRLHSSALLVRMARTVKALAGLCCIALACTLVHADVYMHYIRGGNNRVS